MPNEEQLHLMWEAENEFHLSRFDNHADNWGMRNPHFARQAFIAFFQKSKENSEDILGYLVYDEELKDFKLVP